jgi:Dyp-type peroxidase family
MDTCIRDQLAPVEPVMAMDEIQGLAIPGFFKPHMTLLGVRYEGDLAIRNFKKFLAQLASEVSNAHQTLGNRRNYRALRAQQKTLYPADAKPVVLTAIGFGSKGLIKLTPGATAIPSAAYQEGLLNRSALLGDPIDNTAEGHPSRWIVGGPESELDALIVIGGDERSHVDKCAHDLRKRILPTGARILYDENGDVRADQRGHEHFGFDDGVSQPGIRGRASDKLDDFIEDRHIDPSQKPESSLFGWPGQDLVWPGEFVLGYSATSPDPLIPGTVSPAVPAWTRNGSFLVFRRLRQNVGLFWRTIRDEAERLSKLPGFEAFTIDSLAARLVGRWPSGAPVNRVPDGDDAKLGMDPAANNHFRFDSDTRILPLVSRPQDQYPLAKADPAGVTCPWAAHIRKVNVRDSGSDMGGRDSTYVRRILRTGIPFGKSLPDRFTDDKNDPEKGNRGLLFLCIQSSIDSQFEFLVSRWMGDESRPKTPGGHDVFIGQNATPHEGRERRCTIFGKALQQAQIATKSEWVIPTGGGYFFLPSISALKDVLAK